MAFIEARDGTKLFYKDWGRGKPVVLIHGWCINCDSWEYVMNDLPHRGLRCIAYDQRGCGRSGQPWTGYDYDTLSDDLQALLEHLDLREATLVGHSMGCGVVTRYLARNGAERVARAVLVATTTPFIAKTDDNPEGIDRQYLEDSLAAMKRDRARYVGSLAPGFFGVEKAGPHVSQEMIDWAIALTLQASLQAAVEMMRTNFLTDQRDELKEINVPTLIIHGDADQTSPFGITGQRTAEIMPNSRLKVYEGKAHGLYITEASRLNVDVLEFLSSS
jgi:pimeloyl-ACP methyl ester carboxylesterase